MSSSSPPVQDEFFESLLSDFLDESQQLLGSLNENMLLLDQWVQELASGVESPLDEGLMNELFRSAHSFKGLSGMLGLTDINHLTHNVENVFDAARRGQFQLTLESVELLFQAIDQLIGMVECLRDPRVAPIDCQGVIGDIKQMLSSAGVGKEQQSQHDAERTLAELDRALSAAVALEESNSTESASPAQAAPSAARDLFLGIEDEAEVPAKYLAIYVDEAEQSLDAMSETLLSTEKQSGPSAVEDVLIVAHRFKGSSASVGLHRAAKLAHYMEDILQELREQELPLTTQLTDAMLKCTDGLRGFIDQLKSGASPDTSCFNGLADQLVHANLSNDQDQQREDSSPNSNALSVAAKEALALVDYPMFDEARREQVLARLKDDVSGVMGQVTFDPSFPLLSLKAQLILEKLSQLGRVVYSDPTAELLDDCDDLAQLVFAVQTESSPEAVWRQLHIGSVKRVEAMRIHAPGQEEEASAEEADSINFEYHPQALPVSPAATTSAAGSPTHVVRVEASPNSTSAQVLTEKTLETQPGSTSTAARVDKNAIDNASEAVTPSAGNPAASRNARPAESSKPNETLRVDIERLDQLMNLAGQLVINKARFARIGESLKPLLASKRSSSLMSSLSNSLSRIAVEAEAGESCRNPSMQFETIRSHARRLQNDLEKIERDLKLLSESRGGIVDLLEAVHQLDRVSDGIQKSVMDTRMVPVGPLFTRFKRVVRDITRGNGKDIQLVIRGEKTELDKRMIDELGDPLIHMVRNSADHGVETPAERLAAGKSPQGEITLDAFHRGNSIIIQVKDDGRGLSVEKILGKAMEKGIIAESDAEKLTPHQVYQLIWEPGFSTAEKVTEISGRGMGMDIVRSKIEDLSGVVELDSVPGEGTTFTIKLPLTLAILPSLMARIHGDVFALPIESVVEIVSVRQKEFSKVHGLRTATVRGRVVSVAMLDDVFSWSTENPVAPSARPEDAEETTLVIIGVGGRELGLCVDQLLGEEDIVIKSMAENYRNVEGIAGASILGDGRVALILDTSALIDMASVPRSARNATLSV